MADASVNVFNPEGELKSIPAEQLEQAQGLGYREASPEDFANWQKEQKFGTPLEQIKTFLESAAQAATFGLSTGLERALGVPGRNILARQEVNPLTAGAGQVAGLVAPSLVPGLGEVTAGAALERAGQAGVEALGLTAPTAAAKIGSAATKATIETMMLQGGDEVSKMLAGDPQQSVDSAITNIGLSGVLGGITGAGLGSISPLWKATAGPKVTQFLDLIAKKANGFEGVLPEGLESAARTAGLEMPGEIKALLSDSPMASEMAQNLLESGTTSGTKSREAFANFKGNLSNELLSTLGKTPEDITSLAHYSEAEAGEKVKNSLVDALKEEIAPISEKYGKFNEQFKDAPITPNLKASISDEITKMSELEGYHKAESDAQMNLVSRVQEKIGKQETAEDLKKFITNLRENHPFGSDTYQAAKKISAILSDAQEKAVGDKILQQELSAKQAGVVKGALFEDYTNTKQSYKGFRELLDDLNDRLHVGKYYGPESFMNALREMGPEDVLRRLGKKTDAQLLELLQKKFPQVAESIKDYHLNNLLEVAARRATGEEAVNSKVLFSGLDKMSPELRGFILNPEASQKMQALRDLIEAIPGRKNPSGTAGTLDALWKSMPNSSMGIASMLLGHGPLASMLVGTLGNNVARESTDAIKLGLLKYLGNGQHVSAGAFKNMVEFIDHAIKGQNASVNAVKNVFKAGSVVVPDKLAPKEKDRQKLKELVKEAQANPQGLMNVGGETASYMPEHGSALSQTASNAVQILAAKMPEQTPKAMFDVKIKPSEAERAQEDRMLNIAQQPLMVLQHVKDGTLTSGDVTLMAQLYPALYQSLRMKMGEQLINMRHDETVIPYAQRMSLSVFMGEPLDSTMSPQSIMSLQTTFMPPAPPPGMRAKHSFKDLGKVAFGAANLEQSKEMKRGKL